MDNQTTGVGIEVKVIRVISIIVLCWQVFIEIWNFIRFGRLPFGLGDIGYGLAYLFGYNLILILSILGIILTDPKRFPPYTTAKAPDEK